MSQNITQQIQVVQRSEIGLKRTVNQDSIGVRVPQAGQASQHALFVVADGVGGNLPKGEVASRTAIEAVFAYYYAESDETDMLTRVGDALQDTNIAVRDQAMAEGVPAIGTTIVGLAVAPSGEAIGFNVGDSRLYRIRGGDIELISEDQVSLPEPGVLKDEFKSRRVTKISSYIGQPNLLEPNFYRLKTQPGDTYLLCSDGVWSKIPDEELLQNIDRQPLDQASERLVKLVYERNAPDNLSVVLIRLETASARVMAAPIGEMPTSITSNPSETPSTSSEGGRKITPQIIIGAVIFAAIVGVLALLQSQSNTATATPTVGAQVVAASATSQSTKTVPTAESTQVDATSTTAATAAIVNKATDTAAPSATNTVLPSATATSTKTVTPSNTPTSTLTATKSPTATATVTATHTHTATWTPTTAPTQAAAIIEIDTATATASPTLKPSATYTDVPTKLPSETPTPKPTQTPTTVPSDTPKPRPTSQPTTTVNPTLITYTPSPTFTITPTLTATLTFTATATFTSTHTPTATATFTHTPTFTPTLTSTPSPTLTATLTFTATLTYTPSLTPNAQQAAQTATAKARITPTAVPTLYAPHDDDVITLSASVMFYPSTDSSSFTIPSSGGVELPANTVVKVISSHSTPIDGLIYSYVTLQSSVEGVSSQTGWAALAPAAQAIVTAHIQGGVAIRKGPGTVYERVGLGLKDGERGVVIGQAIYRGQLWYYIDPENPQSASGWIWSAVKGLVLEGNISNVPQKGFPPEPTATATPIPSETPTPSA